MKELPEFEEMMRLAKEDPEKLEELRSNYINEIIEAAPKHQQNRLKGLQFQIDMERRKAKTPLAACIKISEMMHESFMELRDALNDLQKLNKGQTISKTSEEIDKVSAKILGFKSKEDKNG